MRFLRWPVGFFSISIFCSLATAGGVEVCESYRDGLSVLEMKQHGTACLDLAEKLRRSDRTRAKIFDDAGIKWWNKARSAEYIRDAQSMSATRNAANAEILRYCANYPNELQCRDPKYNPGAR